MSRDAIERPDWSVTPADTIAGGASSDNSGVWDTLPSQTAEAVSDLPAGLVSEWSRAGGVSHRLGVAQHAASSVLGALMETAELVAGFDSLPQSVQSAIFSELSLGSSAIAPGASPAKVSKFSQSEEGKNLVAEWRHHAPRLLGIVTTRIRRILDKLSAADREAMWDWFAALDSAEAEAVLRQLAR